MHFKKLISIPILTLLLALFALPIPHAQADGVLCLSRNFIIGEYDSILAGYYSGGRIYDGTTVFISLGPEGIQIVDFSDLESPVPVGAFHEGFNNPFDGIWEPPVPPVSSLALENSTLYLSAGLSGFKIIDVSDLSAPVQLGSYDPEESVTNIAVQDSVAYMHVSGQGIQILDVANPTTPTLLSTLPIGLPSNFPTGQRLVINNSTVYSLDQQSLKIIDVSDPTNPILLNTFDTPEGIDWFTNVGTTLYVQYSNAGNSGTLVIDASDPTNLAEVRFYRNIQGKLVIAENRMYVASHTGLRTYDITNPDALQEIGFYPIYNSSLWIDGNTAHVNGKIIDISNPTPDPELGVYDTRSFLYQADASAIKVFDSTAYITDRENGFQIIDVSDLQNPTPIGSHETPGRALDLTISGTTAYIADDEADLQIYDISTPETPTLLSSHNVYDRAQSVVVSGTTAYVAALSAGLEIIDVSDPTSPQTLSRYNHNSAGESRNLSVVGNTVYLADGDAGLQIYDVSNPQSPVLQGIYDTPGTAYDVAIFGSIAYVADFYGGLQIIDISDPTAPTLLSSFDSLRATTITVDGSIAYIGSTDTAYGMDLIDISNPINPKLKIQYDHRYPVSDIFISGTTAYIAAYKDGLRFTDISDCPPPCPADLTGDEDLNFLDISTFLAAFSTSDPVADFNQDGSFNFLDISEFLNAYSTGCP